jgi:hypothetical protein
VCELDGPIPIGYRSNALSAMVAVLSVSKSLVPPVPRGEESSMRRFFDISLALSWSAYPRSSL